MANMGVPEKKISPYFYAAIIGCIVAMPIVMLFGYLLDLLLPYILNPVTVFSSGICHKI